MIRSQIIVIISLFAFISAQTRSTPTNKDGGGDIIFLDRHSVYCEKGEVMRNFQLQRPSRARMSVKYNCMKNEGIETEETYSDSTNWIEAADDIWSQSYSAHKLAGLPVKCKSGFGIKGWKLHSKYGSPICEIRILFTCTKIKSSSCGTDKTMKFNAGDGEVYSLSVVDFTTEASRALTAFQLNVDFSFRLFWRNSRNFSWTYSYCKLNNSNRQLEENDSVKTDSELQFLEVKSIPLVDSN